MKNISFQFVGQAFIGENGSREYEVHVKDIDGYDRTISETGLTSEAAKQFAADFNAGIEAIHNIKLT